MSVKFAGVTEKEQPPKTEVHAFDTSGRLLASAAIEANQAKLNLPAGSARKTLRFLIGPQIDQPNLSNLSRFGAYEKRLRINPENLKAELAILESVWKPWLLCACVVRGRLIQRLTLL
jgi:hypothetical protein